MRMFENSKKLWDDATSKSCLKKTKTNEDLPASPKDRKILFDQLLTSGEKVSHIARKYGLTRAYVACNSTVKPRIIQKDRDSKIFELLLNKVKIVAITRELGCDKDVVKYILKKIKKGKQYA